MCLLKHHHRHVYILINFIFAFSFHIFGMQYFMCEWKYWMNAKNECGKRDSNKSQMNNDLNVSEVIKAHKSCKRIKQNSNRCKNGEEIKAQEELIIVRTWWSLIRIKSTYFFAAFSPWAFFALWTCNLHKTVQSLHLNREIINTHPSRPSDREDLQWE